MPPTAFDTVVADLIANLTSANPFEARREAETVKGRFETSFRAYVAQAWSVADPASRFVDTWHIGAICDHLQAMTDGYIRRLIINQPPGTAKSLTASVLHPTWIWGPRNKPGTRIVGTSFSGSGQSPSVRDAGRARRVMDSFWYQQFWGDRFSVVKDLETYRVNDRGGYRWAGNMDATGERADHLIIDDPIKLTERLNARALAKCIDDWNYALKNRLDGDASTVLLVMQRVNEDDLSGHFLKRQQEEGWTHLRLPRLFESASQCRVFLKGVDRPFFEDPRTYEGEPLYADTTGLRSIGSLLAERTSEWAWSAEQQQRPTSISGGMLKLAWIARWHRLPDRQLQEVGIPDAWDALLQSWDMAFKKGATNSWVVGQVWGRRGARVFLLDQVRGHWDLPETMKQLLLLSERWPVPLKLVEDKANGPAVLQMLGDVVPGMVAVEPEGSKEARVAAVSTFFESGNVYVPTEDYAPWVTDYVAELTRFPQPGPDDQVDATSQAVWRLLGGLALTRQDLGVLNAGTPPPPFAIPRAPDVSVGSSYTPSLGGETRSPSVVSGGGFGFDLGALSRAFPGSGR